MYSYDTFSFISLTFMIKILNETEALNSPKFTLKINNPRKESSDTYTFHQLNS